MLQVVCAGAAVINPFDDAEAMTASIMQRIDRWEARNRSTTAQPHGVALGWGDAALAAGLATLATLIALGFQPHLRQAVVGPTLVAFTGLQHGFAAIVSTWSAWVAWVVWVSVGLLLTLWFAGSEVRAGWRRTLQARLPR
jgi:hypothetical protein